MNLISRALIVLALLAAQAASAADCPWHMRLTRADGSSLCFDDLPISKAVDRRWNQPLDKVARNMPNFVLAVAKDATCDAVAIESIPLSGAASVQIAAERKECALATCRSGGCDCEIGLDSGRILAARLDPMAPVTVSRTPEPRPSHIERRRGTDAQVAANCPARLQLRDPDGALVCFSDLPIAASIDRRWNRSLERIASQATAFIVATSKDPVCQAAAIEVFGGNSSSAIQYDYGLRDRALGACLALGCECEVGIEGNRILSRTILVGLPLADLLATSPAPAKVSLPNQQPSASPAQGRLENSGRAIGSEQPPSEAKRVATGRPVEAPASKPRAIDSAQVPQLTDKVVSVAVPAPTIAPSALPNSSGPAGTYSVSAQREIERLRDELAKAQEVVRSQQGQLAAMAKSGKRRKALVIGNDSYVKIEALTTARSDARSIARALTNVNFEVSLHTDLAERPMKQVLRDFRSSVEAGDEVVIYYAGHGLQIGGANFLLPTDIQGQSEEQVRDEAIQLQRLLDDMNSRRAGFTLAVIDACRNNPFEQVGRSLGASGGLAPTAAATGQMIIYSAGTGQKALDRLSTADRDGNSVFARVFLKEMNKPGVPVDRVMRTVRQQVVGLARSVGVDQTPALYDQVVGDFYFVPPGAQ